MFVSSRIVLDSFYRGVACSSLLAPKRLYYSVVSPVSFRNKYDLIYWLATKLTYLSFKCIGKCDDMTYAERESSCLARNVMKRHTIQTRVRFVEIMHMVYSARNTDLNILKVQ